MQVSRKVLFSVAAGALIFGMLSYALLANAGAFGTSPTEQGLRVEGHGVIQVFNAQGKLVREWQGYNTLHVEGINAIAACISGVSINPDLDDTCTGLTNGTEIVWSCGYWQLRELPSFESGWRSGCLCDSPILQLRIGQLLIVLRLRLVIPPALYALRDGLFHPLFLVCSLLNPVARHAL